MRLLTIPHTGTHWAKKLLSRMGVEARHHHLFHELPEWAFDEAVVVTLRDPLLSRITTINRQEPYGVEVWAELLKLGGNAYFLPIEHPDMQGLAEFTGGRVDGVEAPPPLNTTDDVSGLKYFYQTSPMVPGALFEDAAWLAEHMTDFFWQHGYDLPWMRLAL